MPCVQHLRIFIISTNNLDSRQERKKSRNDILRIGNEFGLPHNIIWPRIYGIMVPQDKRLYRVKTM
jgi:hypothetical protein